MVNKDQGEGKSEKSEWKPVHPCQMATMKDDVKLKDYWSVIQCFTN